MNVIGSRPTGWWRDRRGAMRGLVQELEAFADETGDEVTVVFDGRPFAVDSSRVDVRFASRQGRNAADDDIAELARPGVTVVTSDGDLAERAEAKGAEVIGAGRFRRRLDEAAG
jgi:uncharacterized protein YaiI (UPF0178 family)